MRMTLGSLLYPCRSSSEEHIAPIIDILVSRSSRASPIHITSAQAVPILLACIPTSTNLYALSPTSPILHPLSCASPMPNFKTWS